VHAGRCNLRRHPDAALQRVGRVGTVLWQCASNGLWDSYWNAAPECGAVCEPGARRCEGTELWQCGSSGLWDAYWSADPDCGAVCQPGDQACDGDELWTCGPTGEWSSSVISDVCGGGAGGGAEVEVAGCIPGDFACGDDTNICDSSSDFCTHTSTDVVYVAYCNAANEWELSYCDRPCSSIFGAAYACVLEAGVGAYCVDGGSCP
jgi:hypothetical protein